MVESLYNDLNELIRLIFCPAELRQARRAEMFDGAFCRPTYGHITGAKVLALIAVEPQKKA